LSVIDLHSHYSRHPDYAPVVSEEIAVISAGNARRILGPGMHL
jgi:hypothetical protein